MGHYVGGSSVGAAYIFTESGGTWSQQAELTASDGVQSDQFGSSVSLSGSGTTALIGAYGHTVGSNALQGVAYVFTGSGGTWSQQAELTASDGAPFSFFGESVSLSGTTALIGAYNQNPGSKVGSNTVGEPGVAYVFTESGGTWSQQAELTASDGVAGDHFGFSVSLSGTTALIGAYGRAFGSGAAYVFTDSGGSWSQQAELTTASVGAADAVFGSSVSLSGTTALIGANGQTVGSNANQGAAYVFTPTVDQAPVFSAASPPLTVLAGQPYAYTFAASGVPAPRYSLNPGAPSWLSINTSTGAVSGTVPTSISSFSYSVTASNSVGSPVTAGPFTVNVIPVVALSFTGSLTYTNSGPITSGSLKVLPSTGTITSVTGTITIPGLSGGSATVKVDIVRVLRLYIGTITISDPSAHFSTTAVEFSTTLTRTGTGQVTGTASGVSGRRPYTLTFTV